MQVGSHVVEHPHPVILLPPTPPGWLQDRRALADLGKESGGEVLSLLLALCLALFGWPWQRVGRGLTLTLIGSAGLVKESGEVLAVDGPHHTALRASLQARWRMRTKRGTQSGRGTSMSHLQVAGMPSLADTMASSPPSLFPSASTGRSLPVGSRVR
jgi:hypothetical protein